MTLQIMKKFKLPLLLLFVFLFSEAFSFDNIKKDKKTIINSVESHKDKLIEISDNIWEAAEPALLEFKSSKYLSDYAEENGFKVTKGVAEIPTAFVAEYGLRGSYKLSSENISSFSNEPNTSSVLMW